MKLSQSLLRRFLVTLLGLGLSLSSAMAQEINPDDYESGAVVLKKGKGGKLQPPMRHPVMYRQSNDLGSDQNGDHSHDQGRDA